ncbi:hypothetical protein JCM10207_001384 [Rhodosporidiobolus poonsookiae]
MLTAPPAVPTQPDHRRKVLSSSPSLSSNRPSAQLASSKPIRAKVDLNAVTSPPSPSWQPGQPVRARVQPGAVVGGAQRSGGYSSAPSTPLASSTPFQRQSSTPTSAVGNGVRATLSPTASTSSRAPSPVRGRSPDGGAARVVTAKVGSRILATPKQKPPDPQLLRGQSDPFPSTPSTVGTATPISYLPSSVSVRRLHSPTPRGSPSLDASTASSTDTHVSSASLLSTSPSTAASSPLTSPNLRACVPDYSAPYDGSVGKRAGSGVRRTSGISSISALSSETGSHGSLLPPLSLGDAHRLQGDAAYPYSSTPLLSPPLQPIPVHANPTIGLVKSPTLSSFPSARSIKATVTSGAHTPTSRPPLSGSNPANRRRHARSNSVTSTSSRTSAQDDAQHPPYERAASWGRAQASPVASPSTNGRSRPASPTMPLQSPPLAAAAGGRAPLSTIDWSSFSAIEDHQQLRAQVPVPVAVPVNGAGSGARTSSGSEVSGLSADGREGKRALSPSSPRREVDEKEREAEREARVERKILDLEITNSSLLSINASLERLKLKHTSEIRELRRRLRESVGGAGLAALHAQAAALDEGASGGESSDPEDDDGASEGDETPEPTWQELLEGDKHFSAVAASLETLVQRAKTALAYQPAANEGNRVLSAVEMEDRLEEVETVDQGVQTDFSGGGDEAPAAGRLGRGLGIVGWQAQQKSR